MPENGRVKVRYIGYARKYDKWRKADDIVDLNESDNNSDEKASSLLGSYQLHLSKFCLFEELHNVSNKIILGLKQKGRSCLLFCNEF